MIPTTRSSPDLGELLFSEEDRYAIVPQDDSFCINTLELANWAARRIVEHRQNMKERKELAELYVARIQSWLDKANKEDVASTEFLTSHLRPFVERELAKQRHSKTIHLPSATLSMRKKPDRIEITDEIAALEYCEVYMPEAVVIRKSLSKTVLKAAVKQGELPTAVEFVPGENELYIDADTIAIAKETHHAA